MKIIYGLIATGVLALAACDKGDDQKKVEEASREAAEKTAEADREAAEKKAEAARELEKTQAEAQKARDDARQSFESDVAAADRKAADLKARAAKATGKTKLNADAAVTELDKRRAVVTRDLETLKTASGDAWDTLKAQTEKDVTALKDAVESLDKTLS